jgi:hypothetical protein
VARADAEDLTPDLAPENAATWAAVILILSVLTGIGVFTLLLLEGTSPGTAALSGLGAVAASVKFLHWLVA